jgi:hypothetical protein
MRRGVLADFLVKEVKENKRKEIDDGCPEIVHDG